MKKLINLIFLEWVCIAPQTYAMRICGGWLVRYTTPKIDKAAYSFTGNNGINDSETVSMIFISDNNKIK